MQYCAVLLLLGLLVFLHELGHFLAAKTAGLPVDRFSLGLGPVLWSRTARGTRYCLSAIPFGGYVLLGLADQDAYLRLPLGKRLVFSLAGPMANILFALGCYGVVYALSAGPHTLAGSLVQPVLWTGKAVADIVVALADLFRQSDVSSLIGIVAEGGRFVGHSVVRFFLLGAHLSVSLAVFNLVPLPPLDGGKVFFDLLERCCRPLSRLYAPTAVCGWIALAGLMIGATIHDVWKYCL